MGKPVSADRSIRRMFWMDQRKTFSSWRTQPNIGLTWKKIDKVTQWIDLETWWNLEILKRTLPPCPTLSHCRPGFQNRYYQASVLGGLESGSVEFTRVQLDLAWHFLCHVWLSRLSRLSRLSTLSQGERLPGLPCVGTQSDGALQSICRGDSRLLSSTRCEHVWSKPEDPFLHLCFTNPQK